jgi:hypothetical protein
MLYGNAVSASIRSWYVPCAKINESIVCQPSMLTIPNGQLSQAVCNQIASIPFLDNSEWVKPSFSEVAKLLQLIPSVSFVLPRSWHLEMIPGSEWKLSYKPHKYDRVRVWYVPASNVPAWLEIRRIINEL